MSEPVVNPGPDSVPDSESSSVPAHVIVVTHDDPGGRLGACLESLIAHTPDPQIILIHNGAGPSPQIPASTMGAVTVVRTPNRGYGAAANLGWWMAADRGATAVVLLNDDVVVTPGWWDALCTRLTGDATLGAVQPLLLLEQADGDDVDADNADSDNAHGGEGDVQVVNSAGVRLGPDGAGRDIGYGHRLVDPRDAQRYAGEIPLFTGGAVLLRVAMLRALGGFDERFMMYYEDVDLGRRGAARGWRYACEPAAQVIHAQGSTTATAVHAGPTRFWQERNRIWVAVRHEDPATIARALWLSVRRLRHAPRDLHRRALVAGLRGAPSRLAERVLSRHGRAR